MRLIASRPKPRCWRGAATRSGDRWLAGRAGSLDPTQIQIADLAKTTQDPLHSQGVRTWWRDYGYSLTIRKAFRRFRRCFHLNS